MARRKTHDEFVAELLIMSPDIKILGNYINAKTKILFECIKCGHIWSTTPDRFFKNKNKCAKCYYYSRTKTHEQFLDDMEKVNKNIIFMSTYKNVKTKILCKCKIDGCEWYAIPNSLLRGGGCPMCSGNKLKTNEEFLHELAKESPTIIPLQEYHGLHSKIKCRCGICNNEWEVEPANLLHKNHPTGCPRCNVSKGEYRIATLLTKYQIKYESQKKYFDLLGVKDSELSYDFYLPSYNLLIEYQGEQHEKPIKFFGGKNKFKQQLIHDDLKRQYAVNNNIKLLEVWYWDFNNIEEIILKILKGGE